MKHTGDAFFSLSPSSYLIMVSIMRDRITATTDTPRRTNSRSVWTLWCLLVAAGFCISKASFSWKKNNKSAITISLWLYFTTTTKILQFFMRQSIWKILGHKTLLYLTLTQELEGGLRSKKVASITAMIIFHVILHPAVHIFHFHIFITLDPNSSRVSSVSWPRNVKIFFSRHCFKISMKSKRGYKIFQYTPLFPLGPVYMEWGTPV